VWEKAEKGVVEPGWLGERDREDAEDASQEANTSLGACRSRKWLINRFTLQYYSSSETLTTCSVTGEQRLGEVWPALQARKNQKGNQKVFDEV